MKYVIIMPAMIISTIISFVMSTFVSPAMTPISEAITQRAFTKWPYRPLSIDQAIQLYRRGVIGKNGYHDFCTRNGLNNKKADQLFSGTKSLLNAQQLIVLKWRGKISNDDFYKATKKIGFDKDVIDAYENSLKYYPNASDFIRFAVRDVYNESIVSKYQYDEDYPQTINKDVAKIGMSPDWMKRYWRAHWVLPSVTQGYEMMHRGEIDEKTLAELLKISDIPQYWREKLINVSYSPFTRVDLRRMYKTGVLNAEQVLRGYMDIGYDKDKAEILTDFTIKYALEEPKTIAESKVKEAYMRGNITDDDAKEMIQNIGYDIESVNFIFSLWLDDKYELEISEEIENIKVNFLYGDIDENTLTDKVTALGLPHESITKVITDIINAKKRLKQLPTKSDITKWFNAKIINEDQYKDMLKQLGYGDIYIENYLQETKIGSSEDFRAPTKADFLAFWKGEIIDTDEWINGMFSLGYSDTDIMRYAKLYGIDLSEFIAE